MYKKIRNLWIVYNPSVLILSLFEILLRSQELISVRRLEVGHILKSFRLRLEVERTGRGGQKRFG